MAALYGLVLLARRRFPLATLVVQLAIALVFGLFLRFPVFMLGPAILVSTYTAAATLPRRLSLPLLAGTTVLIAVLVIVARPFPGLGSLLQFDLLVIVSWSLGDLVSRWRNAAQLHEARATELSQIRCAGQDQQRLS